MINLLPPKVKKEQKVKMISGQINIAIVAMGIMVALTYSAVHLVNYFIEKDLNRNNNSLNETNVAISNLKPVRDQVDQINAKINKIDQIKSKRIDWSTFILNFNASIPEKVIITSFQADQEKGTFSISAAAETREEIVKLQGKLESLDNLKNLSFQNSTFDATNNYYTFSMTGVIEK